MKGFIIIIARALSEVNGFQTRTDIDCDRRVRRTQGRPRRRLWLDTLSPYLGARYDLRLADDWTLTPSLGSRYCIHSQYDNYPGYPMGGIMWYLGCNFKF